MGAKAGGKIDSVLFVCVCVCVCVCVPNFGIHKGVQAKHTFKAGRAGRPGGAGPEPERGPAWGLGRMAPRTKEVPRGGEAKLSRATARLRASWFGQLTPTKISQG